MSEQSEAEFQWMLAHASDHELKCISAIIEYATMIERKHVSDEQLINDLQDYVEALWNYPEPSNDIEDEIETLVSGRAGYVYIVGCVGQNEMFKIGATQDIKSRLQQIATSSPFKPYLVHSFRSDDMYSLEAELHYQFRAKRTHGEWFNLSDQDVIDAIDAGETIQAAARPEEPR